MINRIETRSKLHPKKYDTFKNDTQNKKKALLQYKNKDKTLSEKFVTKFTNKLQQIIDFQKMREEEMQLRKNHEQRSKIINNFRV